LTDHVQHVCRPPFNGPLKIDYLTALRAEHVPPSCSERGRPIVLLEPFRVRVSRFGEFTVPAGFGTDFASVPAFFRRIAPRFSRTAHAAVLHDHLIRHQVVPDADADRIFYAALRHDRINLVHATIMYAGVRIGSALRALKSPRRTDP